MYVEVFVKSEKQKTPICQHSVSEETGISKVQTLSLGATISKTFQGGLPISTGGAIAPCPIAGYVSVSNIHIVIVRSETN